MTTVENRITLLEALPKKMVCAELGVLAGDFSKTLDTILEPSELVLIDHFEGTTLSGDANGENIREYRLEDEYSNVTQLFKNRNEIKIERGFSYEVLNKYPNDYFDFMYLDTDHLYEGTKKELEICFTKIKHGGYLCGHDYSEIHFPGCKRAVDEFCDTHNQQIKIIANDKMPSFLIQIDKSARLARTLLTQGISMLSIGRLNNLLHQMDYVIDNNIPGCFIETGVWQGGSIIMMKTYLKNRNVNRKVYAFDSFQGLPPADAIDFDHTDKHANEYDLSPLVISKKQFIQNLNAFGINEDEVEIKKGWFKTTTKKFKEDIAILRMDGDWYSSTMTVLENMYDRVVSGGVIIFDDYGYWKGCKAAVEDFFNARGEKIELNHTEGNSATETWFRKK